MSRKYRQSGYQDDQPHERGSGDLKRPRKEGPRGRGLGAPSHAVFRCRVCSARNEVAELENQAVCASCKAPLHTCTHCRHFDSSVERECRVEGAALVTAKAKANDCEYFEASWSIESESESKRGVDAKSEFDSLFDF